MRGIRVAEFGGPQVLKYVTDLPSLAKPIGRQLLVRVKSAGINPVDTYIRTGTHTIKPTLPYTPGNDGAGVVEEVGDAVTRLKKGDRVFFSRAATGSYAELALTSEVDTFILHDKLNFQQGAALGVPYATAYRALVHKARLRPSETVFVHGASGAVGIACCQIARALGGFVIGTAGTEEGMKLLLSNGAHLAFNHRQDGYMDKVKAASKSIDVIMEMLANVNLEKDLELAGTGARIVLIGSRGKVEITPRFAMTNEVAVHGVMLFKASEAEWAEMGAFFLSGQEQGWLSPVVGQEYSINQVEQAHVEVMEHKQGTKGKIVLNI